MLKKQTFKTNKNHLLMKNQHKKIIDNVIIGVAAEKN